MRVFDFLLLPVELGLNDGEITLELLMQAPESRLLKCDKLVYVNQVVAECHLVLFLCFIEVAINHLQDGVLRIDLSIVILLVDLHLLL